MQYGKSGPPTNWRKLTQAYSNNYRPIRDHGLIGDQRTCALVGIDGGIDWFCAPRFDSPSIFASILDRRKGGSFRVSPMSRIFETRQFYDGPTNILITEFKNKNGRLELIDFMPCFKVHDRVVSTGEIHRKITCLEGNFEFGVSVEPRMNYGTVVPMIKRVTGAGYSFSSPDPEANQGLALITPLELEEKLGSLSSSTRFVKGQSTCLVLRYAGGKLQAGADAQTDVKLSETKTYWKKWAAKCKYRGIKENLVLRSALALKLLVYSPTGAIIAAPTTSLPEELGGVRNWDYRYSWIRDSSFVIWAFHSIGHDEVENSYLNWLMSAFYLTAQNLQVMVGIDGELNLAEKTLEHLEGYRGSKPVRIGNGAWNQSQLDLYGILVDALYFSHKHHRKITKKIYVHLIRPVVRILEQVWDKPDCGIWEVRGGKKNFVYSKVWCWVALDRAVRIASALNMGEDAEKWSTFRDRIRKTIYERGWNEKINSFVQSYDSDDLDSANLLMPQVRFINGKDPKMISTIKQTKKHLMSHGKFLYRYKTKDSLPGGEGAFLICSFWLVSCLTMAGKLEEAKRLLDSLASCANHVGLFSEEINPKDGTMLGNFPQSFTHMGFISAATGLEKALDAKL